MENLYKTMRRVLLLSQYPRIFDCLQRKISVLTEMASLYLVFKKPVEAIVLLRTS